MNSSGLLRQIEIDNTESVYNKMQDQIVVLWRGLEVTAYQVESRMFQLLKIWRKSARILGDLQRGIGKELMLRKRLKGSKDKSGRYVMRGDTVPNEPYPDIILDVECSSADSTVEWDFMALGQKRRHYTLTTCREVYIDGESA